MFIKILKWFRNIILAILVVLVVIIISIRTPFVQNKIKDFAISFVQDKTGALVFLEYIYIGFNGNIFLENFSISNPENEKIASINKLEVGINIRKLFSSKYHLRKINTDGIIANIIIDENGKANYGFLIDAFSSDDRTTSVSETAPLNLSIDHINIAESDVNYIDMYNGVDVQVKIGALQVKPKNLDLAQMNLDIGPIALENSKIYVSFFEGSNTETPQIDSTSTALDVVCETIDIKNTSISYLDKTNEIELVSFLDLLELRELDVDLSKNSVALSKIQLSNSSVSYEYTPSEKQENQIDSIQTAVDTNLEWTINIPAITLSNNDFVYKQKDKIGMIDKFDIEHVELCSSNLEVENLIFQEEKTAATILKLEFQERSGFEVKEMAMDLSMTPKNILMDKGKVLTGNSSGDIFAEINGSISDLSNMTFGQNTINLSLGFKDVGYFYDIDLPYLITSKPIDINLAFSGSTAKTTINTLSIKQQGLYTLNSKGIVEKITDFEEIYAKLDINNSLIYNNLIVPFLPESVDTMFHWEKIPSFSLFNGNIEGGLKTLQANLQLTNELFQIKTYVDADINDEKYNGYLHFNAADFDKITPIEIPDALKIRLAFDGNSFDLETIALDFELFIDTLEYQDYYYAEIKMKGFLEEQIGQLETSISDPNLTFHLQSGINLRDNISINGHLKQFYINPQKLNLYEDSISVRASIPFSVTILDSSQYDIIAMITDLTIENDSTKATIDYINLKYKDIGNNTNITIESQPFELSLVSNSNTETTVQAVVNSISGYFVPLDSTTTVDQNTMVVINSRIHPHPIINDILLPNSAFTPILFDINLDQKEHLLTIDLVSDKIEYDDIKINGLNFSVDGLEKKMDYRLKTNTISYADYTLYEPQIQGFLKDGILSTTFQNQDKDQKIQNKITILSEKEENRGIFRISPDDLTILYKRWTAHPDNILVYGNKGIETNHFNISHYNSSLGIDAGKKETKDDVEIELSNFDLSHWTEGIPIDSIGISGILNATIQIDRLFDTIVPKAEVTIDNLIFENYEWGDLKIALETDEKKYKTNVSLKGENYFDLQGFVQTSPLYIEQDFLLKKADMAFVNSIAEEYVRDIQGVLGGNVQFKGNTEDFELNGKINFKDFSFIPEALGTSVELKNEQIAINNNKIEFSQFTIRDSLGNTGVLNGSLDLQTYTNPSFDLELTADNFKLLDKAGSRGDLYYGTGVIGATVKIGGDLNQPKVDANLNVHKSTNLTVNIPEENINIIDRESIVVFVDSVSIMKRAENESNPTSMTWTYGGMDLTAIITTDEEAQFRVILDPITGDYLDIRGRSNLLFDVTPLGEMSLTGRFDVLSGVYQLSMYEVIRRRFDILPGGYVSWSGDLFNPDIDLTAQHRVSTNASGLLAGQFSESDNSALRQEIPFLVNLSIDGNLTSPEISFQLDLPNENKGVHNGSVYSKLQQINAEENEVNTQAFALLTLGQFITSTPTVNSGGSEALIRSSASRLLTQQLNQMAGRYIKGFDFNFDLQSYQDFSSENETGRTQLNLEVRKKFLEDRLIVEVGSNFDLEGEAYTQQNSSDIIGDIVAEYLITPEGKYRLKAFRQNKFEGLIDGQITSTGISFVFTKETEGKKTKKKREAFIRYKEEEDGETNK